MLSYIILFLSSIPLLSSGRNFKVQSQLYSLIITSSLFAYTILGFISILETYVGLSRFPILYISILIFLLINFFYKNSFNEYVEIKNFFASEIIKSYKNILVLKQKNQVILICFLLISITISILA